MNRHIVFLLNPISGRGKRAILEPQIRRYARDKGVSYSIQDTTADGRYPDLEQEIQRGRVTDVVVAGGDGSISAVTAALRHTGVRFGILPRGSGNGLAYAAGIPISLEAALEVVFTGHAEAVDGMEINGRFSCMLSGIGFDAEVAHAFAREKTRGFWTYARLSLNHFFTAVPYPFRLRLPQNTWNTEAYFISLANANQFGNQFTIAPKARLNDGLLDVVIVQKMRKWQILLAIIHQVRFGDVKESLFREKSIAYFQTDSLVIENPRLAPLHIDGDPAETFECLQVRVIPAAFQLLLPGPARPLL